MIMTHESPPPDAKQIWQSQRREHPIMSIEEVRIKANMAQMRVRRNLIAVLVFATVLLIFGTIAIVQLPGARPIVVSMMVIVLIVAFQAYRRVSSSQPLPADAALTACTAFYRKELESRAIPPSSLILTLIIYGWAAFVSWNIWAHGIGPLGVRILVPFLLGLSLFLRLREAHRIKKELKALDEFQKGA
jgi:hypothetical protein